MLAIPSLAIPHARLISPPYSRVMSSVMQRLSLNELSTSTTALSRPNETTHPKLPDRPRTPPGTTDEPGKCSQCGRVRPPEQFPIRISNLERFAVCRDHLWYWTDLKKAMHWAPEEVTPIAEVPDGVLEFLEEPPPAPGGPEELTEDVRQRSWVVECPENEYQLPQIVGALQAGLREVATMTKRSQRKSRSKVDNFTIYHYSLRMPRSDEFRLSIAFHFRHRRAVISVRPSNTKPTVAWPKRRIHVLTDGTVVQIPKKKPGPKGPRTEGPAARGPAPKIPEPSSIRVSAAQTAFNQPAVPDSAELSSTQLLFRQQLQDQRERDLLKQERRRRGAAGGTPRPADASEEIHIDIQALLPAAPRDKKSIRRIKPTLISPSLPHSTAPAASTAAQFTTDLRGDILVDGPGTGAAGNYDFSQLNMFASSSLMSTLAEVFRGDGKSTKHIGDGKRAKFMGGRQGDTTATKTVRDAGQGGSAPESAPVGQGLASGVPPLSRPVGETVAPEEVAQHPLPHAVPPTNLLSHAPSHLSSYTTFETPYDSGDTAESSESDDSETDAEPHKRRRMDKGIYADSHSLAPITLWELLVSPHLIPPSLTGQGAETAKTAADKSANELYYSENESTEEELSSEGEEDDWLVGFVRNELHQNAEDSEAEEESESEEDEEDEEDE